MTPRPAATIVASAGLLALLGAFVIRQPRPVTAADPPSGTSIESSAETPPQINAAPEPRVIVHVNRNSVIPGFVELEDDDILVVRDLSGEVHSFAKGRLVDLVRLVDPGPDQRGTLFLLSGQTIDGVIVSDDFENVVMRIEGISTTFKRESISHVLLAPTVMERYERFKASLTPDQTQRHYELCRWLVDEHEYELARTELVALLRAGDYPEARTLLARVEAQLALIAAPRPTTESQSTAEARREERAARQLDESKLLTLEDVNLIRVFEIDFARPPRIVIRPSTIDKIIQTYSTNALIPASLTERQRLYRAEAIQIARLMFRLQARELYGEIEVQTEPYALNLFRQRVHNSWLENNCATSRCHGGGEGGRLYLHRGRSTDPRIRYSNLLTLERLEVAPAWPIINYERPIDSLLIQYGLPRKQARRPHPPADGWQPAFQKPDDALVQQTVLWIDSMLRPRPDYPVEYELPGPPEE